MRVLWEFHDYEKLLKGVKASFIALIPKVEVSTKLGEYRPISLVGSIYKIISKVIATRLSKVIHLVVEDTQSKFMKGRQMLDTVVVAAKVIHDVKSLKKQALIFKAYFKKAYDNINWSYLMYMMRRKGGVHHGEKTSAGRPNNLIPIPNSSDTLLFLEPKVTNVQVLKRILKWFELVAGLRVNFHKSSLAAIGVQENLIRAYVNLLNCFIYVGIAMRYSSRDGDLDRVKVEVAFGVVEELICARRSDGVRAGD
ncbi:hypothetical protein Fmac_017135 [Flemingia macrophylla]|uniref:Reverse transcriptase domain-containing protein n=1 Tax=Flemingia macrophylla TaxID=520843 RepID=A0ABD1M1A1_9FABA